jgi:nitrogen fixation NifU-like protein
MVSFLKSLGMEWAVLFLKRAPQLSQLLKGKSSEAALSVIDTFQAMLQSKGNDQGDESILEDGVAFAGVAKFPARVKCALLGWMATKDAISQSQALTGNNATKEQR